MFALGHSFNAALRKANVLDVVNYDINWYQDVVKVNGGWSLELINPNLLCQGSLNWIASNNASGGTPGSQNSVHDNTPDATAPAVVSANFSSNTQVQIEFVLK